MQQFTIQIAYDTCNTLHNQFTIVKFALYHIIDHVVNLNNALNLLVHFVFIRICTQIFAIILICIQLCAGIHKYPVCPKLVPPFGRLCITVAIIARSFGYFGVLQTPLVRQSSTSCLGTYQARHRLEVRQFGASFMPFYFMTNIVMVTRTRTIYISSYYVLCPIHNKGLCFDMPPRHCVGLVQRDVVYREPGK